MRQQRETFSYHANVDLCLLTVLAYRLELVSKLSYQHLPPQVHPFFLTLNKGRELWNDQPSDTLSSHGLIGKSAIKLDDLAQFIPHLACRRNSGVEQARLTTRSLTDRGP